MVSTLVRATSADEAPLMAPMARTAGISRIVVPLDGSRFARAALAPAARLARALGATLTLVQAAAPAHVPGIDADLAIYLGESDAALSLRDAAASPASAGLRVNRVLVRGELAETPAAAVLRVVSETNADLIVMATHGRTGLVRAALGSVADAVVAATPVPVLLVHPRADPGAGAGSLARPGPGTPRLLVALDATLAAEAALGPAAALATGLGATVELAHVLVDTGADIAPEGPSAVTAAGQYLEAAAKRLHAAGVPAGRVRTAVLYANGRDVADTLLAYAARSHATMLVVATHARRGIARFLRGSVEAVAVARAPFPILAVRIGHEAARDP